MISSSYTFILFFLPAVVLGVALLGWTGEHAGEALVDTGYQREGNAKWISPVSIAAIYE